MSADVRTRGKVVQIHRGPAAVIGDENHTKGHSNDAGLLGFEAALAVPFGEGVVSRSIRKPEDLPVIAVVFRGASG